MISYHEDMFDHIIRMNLLKFVIQITDKRFPAPVQRNAVLAISLLTYNDKLFDEIIDKKVIDLILSICMDDSCELTVKEFSTLALVHFALNKKSINILVEKGILSLFDTFSEGSAKNNINVIIQTNISWIFVALCNNGISGKTMLEQGITRDMFLVSCRKDYQQIRHLVITGFAELGLSQEKDKKVQELLPEK